MRPANRLHIPLAHGCVDRRRRGPMSRFRALAPASALLLALFLLTSPWREARAAETQVAVAANFTEPAREIAVRFNRATGHTAVLSFGSSGSFYAQISHGAPWQVFLS